MTISLAFAYCQCQRSDLIKFLDRIKELREIVKGIFYRFDISVVNLEFCCCSVVSIRYSLTSQITSIRTQWISEEQVYLLEHSFVSVELPGLFHLVQSFLQLTAIHTQHAIDHSIQLLHAAAEAKCCHGDVTLTIRQPTMIIVHINRQTTQLNDLCHSERGPAEAARSQTELAGLEHTPILTTHSRLNFS